MAKADSAMEGVFNPDVTIRTLIDNVRANLEKNYTTVDAAEKLAGEMRAEAGEINQLILDISNIMARVHNGETTKADAIAEATPLVKSIKGHCTALHLDSALAPEGDICETELQMLKEFTTQALIVVDQHISNLKGEEGSDQEGKAATIADGAASESLFSAMLNGNTAACENFMRSDNMNSVDVMNLDPAQEGLGETIGKGIDNIGNAIKAAAKKVWEFLKKIVSWIIAKIKQIATMAKNLVMSAWSKFVSLVKTLCSFVKSKAQQLWGALMNVVKAAKTKGGNLLASAKAKFNEIKQSIKDKLATMKAVREAKKAAAAAAKNGTVPPEAMKEVQDAVDSLAEIANKAGQLDVPAEAKAEAAAMLSTVKEAGAELGSAVGANGGDEPNPTPTESTDSFTNVEAFDMARVAAKNGDLEGAIEAVIGAITGNAVQSNEPSEEDIATENALLEMELLNY